MCLNSAIFALVEDEEDGIVGYGYKAVYKDMDGDFRGIDYLGDIPKDVWMKSNKPTRECEETRQQYLAGFHLFLDVRSASQYSDDVTVLKFKFRNVLAFGMQDTSYGGLNPCIIADEIKFVEQV